MEEKSGRVRISVGRRGLLKGYKVEVVSFVVRFTKTPLRRRLSVRESWRGKSDGSTVGAEPIKVEEEWAIPCGACNENLSQRD